MTRKEETFKYDANVELLLSIIINSVYSNKEFFIRELVANASDACDKFAFSYNSFSEQNLSVESISNLRIDLIPNRIEKTLIIEDNAIGMTKVQLLDFLGRIANSGTKAFKEALADRTEPIDTTGLIGQFGLGFYSAFLVAKQVDVITRHPEEQIAHKWSSKGDGEFTVEECEKISHGTQLVLHIKEGDEQFIQDSKLKELLNKFSKFIAYPVFLHAEKEIEDVEDRPEEVAEIAEEKLGVEDAEDVPTLEQLNEDKPEAPKKMKKVIEHQRINNDKQLWMKNLKDVSPEELKEFYKSVSNDWDDFLKVKSWSLEGVVNFKMLLFIPKRAPFNMFDKATKKDRIKLYCANVFVTDDLQDAVPEWMYFVTGIIAADDLPMSVSRESTQGSTIIKLIKKRLQLKVLEMISELKEESPELYEEFYKQFSSNLKLAVKDDQDSNGEEYAKLLQFYSTRSLEKEIDLDTYVNRMGENQKQIYIITGMTKEEVVTSPFLAKFSDYEVLFFCEPVDEIMLQSFRKFRNIDIQRITSEGVDIKSEVTDALKTEF